jgi:DNA uptake protein ComE-like DNA-binding protein
MNLSFRLPSLSPYVKKLMVLFIGGVFSLVMGLILLFTSSSALSTALEIENPVQQISPAVSEKTSMTVPSPEVSPVPITQGSTHISINTALLVALDELPGVGEKTGQKIIDHRPYTSLEQLLEKKVLSPSLFQKIKGSLSL